MKDRILKTLKHDKGAVQIVEAAFVFPVMFIVLFFLLFMGNVYFVRAQVESVVEQYAIKGAAMCADPLLEIIQEGKDLPALNTVKLQPYRYIFGGMNDVESKINDEVVNEINNGYVKVFKGMKPKLLTSKNKISKYENHVVYSTFAVEVKYSIKFPISYLGKSTPPVVTVLARSEMPVNDCAEFIRNVDMVIDLFHGTELGKKISTVFGKMNDFLTNFAKK